MLDILFLLIAGHFICDFVFQGDTMAMAKNHRAKLREDHGPGFPPWPYWLIGHGTIHGAAVMLITGSLLAGAVETLLHSVIDYLKCDGRINVHTDQALHATCKLAYCYLLYQSVM